MGFGDAIRKITGATYESTDKKEANYIDDVPSMANSNFGDDYDFGNSSAKGNSSKVLSIAATTHLQVIVFKPQRYSEAGEIAEHFKNKKTIVLNLESTNKEVAGRLIDFLGGAAYALGGEIKRISHNTYMLVTYNVEISGDTIEELESSSDLF